MWLATLLIAQTLVGAFFACVASVVPVLVGVLWLHVTISDAGLLLAQANLVGSSQRESNSALLVYKTPGLV